MEQPAEDREVDRLGTVAAVVLVWLSSVLIASASATALLLGGVIRLPSPLHIVVLCITGGILGSAVSALVSAWERIANGWERANGEKLPKEEPKDKFLARMSPQFILRPLLGAVMGLLVYGGIIGGYLITVQVENLSITSFRPEGLLFVSLLAGLFAKTFIEKLRDMFDALFGKQKSH